MLSLQCCEGKIPHAFPASVSPIGGSWLAPLPPKATEPYTCLPLSVVLSPDRRVFLPLVLLPNPFSPPFHSHKLLADLLGLSHYKWNVWGSLDVHPILDHQGRQRRGIIKPQVVDRAGQRLVGQLKKGRDVPYLPREEDTSVGLCLPPLPMDGISHRCPLLTSSSQGPSVNDHLGILEQGQGRGWCECPLYSPGGARRGGGIQVDLPRAEGKHGPALASCSSV